MDGKAATSVAASSLASFPDPSARLRAPAPIRKASITGTLRDPRADVLAAAAERFYRQGGDERLYDLARFVEATALRLLHERKPDRRLDTNVEFYTALLLHGLDLSVELFTPTFAVGRVAGWTAHALEQLDTGRLIRPQSEYVGEGGRSWVDKEARVAVPV